MSSKKLKHVWAHCARGQLRGRDCARCDEVDEYKRLWAAALENMPWMFTRPERTIYSKEIMITVEDLTPVTERVSWVRPASKDGQKLALRMCLGYNCYNAKGKSTAWLSVPTATARGQKPRTIARQRLLKALAGPYGATVARIRLIQLGQATRFHHWPGEPTK